MIAGVCVGGVVVLVIVVIAFLMQPMPDIF